MPGSAPPSWTSPSSAAASYAGRADLFRQGSLNALLAAGPEVWAAVREWLQGLLLDPSAEETVRAAPASRSTR